MAFKIASASFTLGELLLRVPRNQMKKFEEFQKKTLEYFEKAEKFPDSLPAIDWNYYRFNVREDYVKMVDQFREKYEKLDHNFANRHEALDHSKYYTELDKIIATSEAEVKTFIEESNKRIELLEHEIHRVKHFKYDNMTVEEYLTLREEESDSIPGKDKYLFWPHNPEEQLGYVAPKDVPN